MISPYCFKLKIAFTICLLSLCFKIYGLNPDEVDITFGKTGFNGKVNIVKQQSDGKILAGGEFTIFKNIKSSHLVRLNEDGSFDTSFDIGTGFNGNINSIVIQSDGKIIVGGQFTIFNGTPVGNLIRLNEEGSIDNYFNIGIGFDGEIQSIVIQPDNKILIGGSFNSFNGILQKSILRLNLDGTIDNNFEFNFSVSGAVKAMVLQSNGEILLGLNMTSIAGRIIRINSDGTLDKLDSVFYNQSYASYQKINSIVLQNDDKILVGGKRYDGSNYYGLLRYNVDGTIDISYKYNSVTFEVNTIVILNDKIVVGGKTLMSSTSKDNRLVQLLDNGEIDNSFILKINEGEIKTLGIQSDNKLLIGGDVFGNGLVRIGKNYVFDNSFKNVWGPNNSITAIANSPDGSLIVGGIFTTFNGIPMNHLARIKPDGSLDTLLKSKLDIDKTAYNQLRAVAVQSDGKILVGWRNGFYINSIVRLNIDGSIDSTFKIGTGSTGHVLAITIQKDNKILIGGFFSSFNGVSASKLIRLNADGTVDPTFNFGPGSYGEVGEIRGIRILPDDKIIVNGYFSVPQPEYYGRHGVIRLNKDGSVDKTFNRLPECSIDGVAVQNDGKILIGGENYPSTNIKFFKRLNIDGTDDLSFNTGKGFSGNVYSIACQADGKILVSGSFQYFNGKPVNYFVFLNTNGSIDSTLNYDFKGIVENIFVQENNKIVLLTGPEYYNNSSYRYIVRLTGIPPYFNIIRGNIYKESNKDCKYQTGEKSIASVIVRAHPGAFYGNSDIEGKYRVMVDSGLINYTLTQEFNTINSKLLIPQCNLSHNVALKSFAVDTSSFDFVDSLRECSLLNVSIQSSRMRRCFKGNTFVKYCNYGNQDASSAQLKIVYPSYVVPINSVPMWTSKQDSVLIYDLGTIQKESCGKITIIDSVKCGDESIRGLTQCIKAIISPSTNCVSQNPAWDRSSISVTGTCTLNNNAHFIIENKGFGDMLQNNDYRVYLNDTLIYNNAFKLSSGQSFTIDYPASGKVVRVEADQHPLHPGNSLPRAIVQTCGSTSNKEVKGFVTTTLLDDLDEEVAFACNEIIDSYDPNDKFAIPVGIGDNYKINHGAELEYSIRFQNTGTDTAYSVRVVDTLDVALDVASFTEGVSSHPYRLQVSGKGNAILTFNFDNINLPDSTRNKLESNGLVSFRIRVPESTATGTVIKNKAYIYFDYNSPIITNEIFHTVDPFVPEDFSKGDKVVVNQDVTSIADKLSELVKVYPNPANGKVTVILPEGIGELQMIVYSMDGVKRRSIQLNDMTEQKVNLEGLQQGMYIYEFRQNEQRKAGGTLVIY